MKRLVVLVFVVSSLSLVSLVVYNNMFASIVVKSNNSSYESNSHESFYDLSATTIDGKIINFSIFEGKKALVVNVASKCGYTPQYEDLQWLHDNYGDKITILGFPSNNFGRQEPGSNTEIVNFCKSNYGVQFQLFEKIEVKGDNIHPVYKWLSSSDLNGWNDKKPKWNFYKYLIDENGELKKILASSINPRDSIVLDFINAT